MVKITHSINFISVNLNFFNDFSENITHNTNSTAAVKPACSYKTPPYNSTPHLKPATWMPYIYTNHNTDC